MDLRSFPIRRPCPPSRAGRLTRAAAGVIVAGWLLAGTASVASAGGWAATTLDEMPAPVPGEPVEVGFTIRQHGVHPVDVGEEVAIEISAAGEGAEPEVFPATQQGLTGHYRAEVVFPRAGDYTWLVRQGMFGPRELGSITVAAPPAAGGSYRYSPVIRYGLPVLAGILAAVALGDVVVGRRRRRLATA